MIRTLFWMVLWCLCLGDLSVDATYRDGLHIRLYNRKERRQRKEKNDS